LDFGGLDFGGRGAGLGIGLSFIFVLPHRIETLRAPQRPSPDALWLNPSSN
jgi:hypothetical protein